MKASANVSGEKLIADYLNRLAHASTRRLPKGARMAFVGRTRAALDYEWARQDRSDPAVVAAVLAKLGEPEELVRQERAKIDAAWANRRAAKVRAGEVSAGTPTPAPRRQPSPRQPSDTTPFPALTIVPAPRATEETSGDEDRLHPARSDGPADRLAAFARTVGTLVRTSPLETAAVVLIGVGGLLFPILPPVWLLGVCLSLPSRLWDVRDKWVGLAGPMVVTLAGSVVIALIVRGPGNPAVIYMRALGADSGFLLRLGCLLAAGYLARSMHRGPRLKVPPWRRS